MTLVQSPPITISGTTQVSINDWSTQWRSLAQDWRWLFLLSVIGSFSSAIYAHPPFASFAVVAGTTLMPRKAIGAAMTIWLFNQIFGYGLRGYPHTLESLGWGLLMAGGAFLVTRFATLRPQFSQESVEKHLIWVGVACISGFLVFEGLMLLFWAFLGGHSLTVGILGRLLSKEVIWTIALTLVHLLLVRFSSGHSKSQRM